MLLFVFFDSLDLKCIFLQCAIDMGNVLYFKAFNCTILFICLWSTHVSQCIERCNDYRKEKCIIIWSELLDNICLFVHCHAHPEHMALSLFTERVVNKLCSTAEPQLWSNLPSHYSMGRFWNVLQRNSCLKSSLHDSSTCDVSAVYEILQIYIKMDILCFQSWLEAHAEQ